MQAIRELYDIIADKMDYGEHEWATFKTSLNSEAKRQFFTLFEKGLDSEQIALKLSKSSISKEAFRNIKSYVKSELYSELLKFKASNYHYTPFQQAYYKALQQYSIFKTLIGFGRNHTVLDIGENLLKRAMTYDFTDIVVEVSKQLFLYYSVKEVNLDRVEKYIQLHRKYSEVLRKEANVEVVWARIASLSAGDSSDHILATRIAKNYLDVNKLPATQIVSSRFYLRHYLIMVYYAELNKDYQTVEKISVEAYHYFCSLTYEHKLAKEVFIHKVVYAQLWLSKVNESFKSLNLAIKESRLGHANWFLFLELKLRALLIPGKYDQAHQTYQSMIDHRNFDHQPLHHRIRWVLLGSYVQFLRVVGLASGEKPTAHFINKHFKFLDEHRNQLGDMKVPYIISQLLFSICRRDYDGMEQRIYALKTFCHTYLKKSTPNYRSSCFIKMLLLVPQNNFHPKVVERRVGLYLRRLEEESHKIDPARIVEVIPYEKLWSIILDHLSAPKRARKSDFNLDDWTMGKRELH